MIYLLAKKPVQQHYSNPKNKNIEYMMLLQSRVKNATRFHVTGLKVIVCKKISSQLDQHVHKNASSNKMKIKTKPK